MTHPYSYWRAISAKPHDPARNALIYLLVKQGRAQAEIGARFGISGQRVSQIARKEERQIRRRLQLHIAALGRQIIRMPSALQVFRRRIADEFLG